MTPDRVNKSARKLDASGLSLFFIQHDQVPFTDKAAHTVGFNLTPAVIRRQTVTRVPVGQETSFGAYPLGM